MRWLIRAIKGFSIIIKSFFYLLFKILSYPGRWLAKMLKFIMIYVYKLWYWLKHYLKLIFPDERIKPIYLFINRYISHIIIIVLVLIISFSNFFTTGTSIESFGEKSILYALASGSDAEGQYTEEAITGANSPISSYNPTSANATPSSEENNATPETSQIQSSENTAALIKPQIPSIDAAKPQRDAIIQYTVKQGDSIGTIADNFGVSQQTILWENKLSSSSYIRPGQVLTILPTNGISYKIAKGDTLSKVAAKYKSDVEKIIDFNRLANQQDIQVGQIIIIPEGQPYVAPTVSTPRLAQIKQIFEPPAPSEIPTGSGQMLWPNGCHRITQYFSWHHTGVDIACTIGTPIRAAEDGVVYVAEYKTTGYGHSVRIDHGGGKATVYGHMTTLYVKVGDVVKQGQVIGLEGSTGHSTGPHLHFEVRFNNKWTNPLNYIK